MTARNNADRSDGNYNLAVEGNNGYFCSLRIFAPTRSPASQKMSSSFFKVKKVINKFVVTIVNMKKIFETVLNESKECYLSFKK
ncbi:hypothetical protein P5673_023658 [Acropora cervicornis]|uniref:Uncharacterized protein n=1 Tax=Acropora cervicornis TaxID=6130 RepID=A0AAD9UYS4_ACRCE|nr:hypothetical protein P5673_023658 [Acropora cervicornis]